MTGNVCKIVHRDGKTIAIRDWSYASGCNYLTLYSAVIEGHETCQLTSQEKVIDLAIAGLRRIGTPCTQCGKPKDNIGDCPCNACIAGNLANLFANGRDKMRTINASLKAQGSSLNEAIHEEDN